MGLCLPWGMITTICANLLSRNHGIYILVFNCVSVVRCPLTGWVGGWWQGCGLGVAVGSITDKSGPLLRPQAYQGTLTEELHFMPTCWSPSQYKDRLSSYSYFHCKDKPVMIPHYNYNGNPDTGKMPSSYWAATTARRPCVGNWLIWELRFQSVNSLWPSDTIWQHKSGSALAQAMACCLTAPRHYPYQCWLIISKVQWRPSQSNFKRDTSTISHWN